METKILNMKEVIKVSENWFKGVMEAENDLNLGVNDL